MALSVVQDFLQRILQRPHCPYWLTSLVFSHITLGLNSADGIMCDSCVPVLCEIFKLIIERDVNPNLDIGFVIELNRFRVFVPGL